MTLIQDLRFALRIARQNPGSTFAAFIALTLGIGAATAIFSVVNSVILRPLPVRDEASVVRIFETDSRSDKDPVSMADYFDWKGHLKSFASLALYRLNQANLSGEGVPERVRTLECDSKALPLLGVTPARGRNFYPEEDQPGHGDVAMLSWSFWRSHFGMQSVIGRKIILDEKPYTIVGILPHDFLVLGDRDIWLPVTFDLSKLFNTRGYRWYMGLGRLRPGVSVAQANAELATMAASLAAQYPKQNSGVSARLITLRDSISGNVQPALLMLFGGVLCVLFLACGNVANLALARASARQREISVRIAVGASRARLFRQLLTENILLSLGAALAGLGLAAGAVRVLRTLPATHIPHPEEITLDWRVLLFAIAIGALTGMGFGLAPAIRASLIRVHDTLKQSSGRLTESKQQQRLRTFFVACETAVAALLLIQSALLIKSYAKASQIHLDFEPDHLLAVHVSLSSSRFDARHPGAIDLFARGVLQGIRRIPGVQEAAMTTDLPMTGTGGGAGILVEGEARPKNMWDTPYVQWTRISPGYFRTMKIPRIAGREFDERDRNGAPRVAIVNEALVRQFFDGRDPIEKHLSALSDQPQWREIVGVVADVPQLGIEKKALPEAFFPLAQVETQWLAILVRTNGNPLAYVNAVRAEVRKVDPAIAVFLPRTMEQIITEQLGWRVFQTSLVGVFAVVALLLACIGIYSVAAYSVTQRVTEIGIRMALGADSRSVLRMIIRQGATPALVGTLAGALCSLGTAKLLSELLYGITFTDPASYLTVLAILFTVAMLGSYIPARRAAALDPGVALHYE